jgi:hypothetical protein
VQQAAAHPHFISDTSFSSPANVTTIQYVNGTTVVVYSSASSLSVQTLSAYGLHVIRMRSRLLLMYTTM